MNIRALDPEWDMVERLRMRVALYGDDDLAAEKAEMQQIVADAAAWVCLWRNGRYTV